MGGGGGGCMINLFSLNRFVTLTKFSLRVAQERGHHVHDLSQRGLLSVPHPSGLLALSLDHSPWEGLPIQGSVLWPFYRSPGLYQGV